MNQSRQLGRGRSWQLGLGPVRITLGDQKRNGSLRFQCNICGQINEAPMQQLRREVPTCMRCASTVRFRAIVALLSSHLFGQSLLLPDFPHRPDLIGLGLSDWEGYAKPLAGKLGYTNTYFDREPRLDITQIDRAREGTLDFLIASEVLEHVHPPVAAALANIHRLLKPGGLLVLTVPFFANQETREHFPDLHESEIVERSGKKTLINRTIDGEEQVFDQLVFHGGDGATLEMRVFGQTSLQRDVLQAGFTEIAFHGEPVFEHGIYWHNQHSLPITTRSGPITERE
jgi:SAM-dependent methyltransferase